MRHSRYGWWFSMAMIREEMTEEELSAYMVAWHLDECEWVHEIADAAIERIHDRRLLANWSADAQGIDREHSI